MSKRIFKNIEHQKIFDKQGFIVLPFLNEDEVQKLDELFDDMHPNIAEQSGFFSSSYSSDQAYKQKASDEIVKVFDRAYRSNFINYTPFGATFLYKIPGENSELQAHQDWTIVDEQKYVAVNCWVPLCDVTLENGPIMIMPGSHFDNLESLRAPTLPFFFSGEDDMVVKELEPMEVKAGTAVVLNQSVIHYSPPNKGNKVRKAITAGLKSKGAQMYFHYKIPEKDELEVFEVEDDFLISFKDFMNDIGKRPYFGKSIGTIPNELPKFKGKELYNKLKVMKHLAGFEMNNAFEKPPVENKSVEQPQNEKKGFFRRMKEALFS